MRAVWLLPVLCACVPKTPPAPAGAPQPVVEEAAVETVELNPEAVAGVEDPALRRLLHDHWEHSMAHSPVWATMLGDRRFDDRLGDWSQEAVLADRDARHGFLQRARDLPEAGLPEADRLTLALFVEDLENDLATDVCEFWQWSLSPRDNTFVDLAYVPEAHRIRDARDAETLRARYHAMPAIYDTAIDNLGIGLLEGRVANRESVALVLEQLSESLDTPVDEWALLDLNLADGAFPDPAAAEAFEDELRQIVQDEVLPAVTRYRDFVRDEVLPAARPPEAAGLGGLPDGGACYEALVRNYTTLDITAGELHQTGRDELRAIHAEFRDLGEKVLGTRDLAEIFARLRTDPDLFFDSPEALEQTATEAVAKARAALPEWFGTLPKAEVVVRAIPDHEAPFTTIAYYRSPAPDGSKPGEYFVNTWAPETRPRFEAEVLAFHEAIPGHHLQIAIAQELPEMPAFRRYGGFTAFVEGWALYTERLADEMGLYADDTSRLGMLSFDAWRAGRLVVDTGIHAKGWTREDAVAFLLENTPTAENNVVNEVDRYITTPGQALAYKTGALTIARLRADAEARLGAAFDVRAFHDTVLEAGAVPLPVLERRVAAWVEGRLAAATAPPAADR